MNNNIVLISGKSTTGKSTCLKDIENLNGVLYLNCESNKALTFPNASNVRAVTILDPYKIYTMFDKAEESDKIDTIVIDSITYCMDLFETKYIQEAADTQAGWGQYAEFFKKLMNTYVAKSTKRVVIIGHTADVYNEKDMVSETMVKVKGSLMARGLESAFTNVISTKRMDIEDLEGYDNPLLNITEEEEIDGFKYVFQTKLTKETRNERIRGPIGMWERNETFIDNDITHVFKRIEEYYQ